VLIGVKVVMSFLGFLLRGLSTVLFLVDCYLINTFVISLYFYLEGYHQSQYTANGFWVVAFSFALFGASIGFVISCMIKDNKRVYNFILGIVLMTAFAAILLQASMKLFPTPNFNKSQFIVVLGIVGAYNLYFAINSYQIITFRTEKFYDDEFSYCFFCYFTDWLLFFWIDLFKNASFHRLKVKAENMARLNLKKKQKEMKNQGASDLKNSELVNTRPVVDVEANNGNNSF